MPATEIVMTQEQATELFRSIRDCIARIDRLTDRLDQTDKDVLAVADDTGTVLPDLG